MRRKYTPPREIRNTSKLKREAAERRQALRKAGLTTYTTGLRANQAAIVCLCCGLGSSNQYDIYQRYCGFCEAFHDDVPGQVYQVRDAEEIQRAHDILVSVITGDVNIELEPEAELAIPEAASVLCWVLKHDHDDIFPNNLAELERAIGAAGYVLENHGRPLAPEERP